jgi:hypothetical protein
MGGNLGLDTGRGAETLLTWWVGWWWADELQGAALSSEVAQLDFACFLTAIYKTRTPKNPKNPEKREPVHREYICINHKLVRFQSGSCNHGFFG